MRQFLGLIGSWSLVALSSATGLASGSAPVVETWAGHQVVYGARDIAVLGQIETRADSFVLAEVVRSGEWIELRQRACNVDFKETLGVKVRMSPDTLARLPEARFRLRIDDGRVVAANPWVVAWGPEDLDRDGHPGATVHVDSTLCGGDMYVASATTSEARGRLRSDGLAATIEVHVQQEVLDASGFCLSMASEDTDEKQKGRVEYRRVAPGTTCDDLAGRPWPVRAESVAAQAD